MILMLLSKKKILFGKELLLGKETIGVRKREESVAILAQAFWAELRRFPFVRLPWSREWLWLARQRFARPEDE